MYTRPVADVVFWRSGLGFGNAHWQHAIGVKWGRASQLRAHGLL
jgi:hypothetical protein